MSLAFGRLESLPWADVRGIDVLLILREHFLIVSQDPWEENVCGGVCGRADARVLLP